MSPYLLVNKKSKYLRTNHVFPSETSWEFSKKEEYNTIINKWQMYF